MAPVSRTLGEMAYSIYLLYGFLLFTLFTFGLGPLRARSLSPMAHWTLVVLVAPALILLCFATFRLIKRPAMQRSQAVTAWLRRRLTP